jgi:hypothetical protein
MELRDGRTNNERDFLQCVIARDSQGFNRRRNPSVLCRVSEPHAKGDSLSIPGRMQNLALATKESQQSTSV